ncbi:autotransporter assembly complex protein TamA [Sandarakinorhabdus sp. DWP1-3-1]|uniref:autotransporter assembly complex protein TamA n=1 Tax=Sandarakinorhabdus sp. DWP1-3-1 TaxID=2804627 RepID=UPI003CEF51AD
MEAREWTKRRLLGRALGVSLLALLPMAAAAQPADLAPPTAVPLPTGEPSLDEFAPLPGNVPWPTVETTTAGEAVAPAGDVRYTVALTGLAETGLDDEWRALSSLWTRKGEVSNLAQINRRIAEDRDLIDQLLRSIGRYGGNTQVVVATPTDPGATTSVTLTVDPGPQYRFDSVIVSPPADAAGSAAQVTAVVTPLLGIAAGDPINATRVTTAQDTLPAKLADAGYPFPVIGKPDIVVDHATRTATLAQTIDLGARGVFGSLHIEGETQKFDDEHLAVLARFKPGQPYTEAGRDDLRRALIQTGLFGGVIVKPVPGGRINADGAQVVDLVVTTEAAPVRTVAATGGYSTGQGLRVEASWTHRNLFPPEGALTVRTVAAERQQVLAGEIQRRNWKKRDQTLSLRMGLSAEQQNAFDASTFAIGGAVARESNIIWQKPITYSIGGELLVTRQRDRSAPNDPNNTYFILAFPGNVTWDQSDNLLDPTRGFRLTGRVSPEFTLRSGSYLNYVKLQVEGSVYRPLGDSIVLAGRIHFGGIAGASRGRIAPDRRFYAGGGGSVRGFDFQGVGPQNADGTPTGGNSLTEASAEVRYRFQAFGNDLGVVGFVDAGQVYASTLPKLDSLRIGAGIGLRYYTAFGPVRIDVATPVTRRTGDPRVAFYVSIGQAF